MPQSPRPPQIEVNDFVKLDIRVGTITEALPFPEARTPAYRLLINFGGEIGVKRSSAQITKLHSLADLLGRQVLAVVNFAPRQIGPMVSEVLVLGVPDANGDIVLVMPGSHVPNGGRVH